MSRTYLRKCMTFKFVKQLNPIGKMKTLTKPNFNICMEKRLTIPKNLRDKRIMVSLASEFETALNSLPPMN